MVVELKRTESEVERERDTAMQTNHRQKRREGAPTYIPSVSSVLLVLAILSSGVLDWFIFFFSP